MLGEAFMERRAFNEADVRNVPSYLDTRNGVDPPYRAVLCIPIFVGEEPIGMLTADKRNAVLFGTAADDIARGLAAQCALAIDQFRKAG
jgi:GAF domain-containing protein